MLNSSNLINICWKYCLVFTRNIFLNPGLMKRFFYLELFNSVRITNSDKSPFCGVRITNLAKSPFMGKYFKSQKK